MFKLSSRVVRLIKVSSYYQVSVTYPANKLTETRTCCCPTFSKNVATSSASQYIKELIYNGKWSLQNALRKVGFLDFARARLRRNGYYIYDEVIDNLDYQYFFRKFNMPDTFNSWFLVMELHIWMVLVRLMAETEEGRFVRNMVIEAMWEDVRQKAGLLGTEHTGTARKQIKVISEEFQAALLSYDEGLLSSDIVLAGALWRRFFRRECNDPELVELLVRYIRKQIRHFDSLSRDEVLLTRRYEWFPIEDKKLER